MTENEFMLKAVKAGHKAAEELRTIIVDFDETSFIFQSALHMSYLAEEIFDKKGDK